MILILSHEDDPHVPYVTRLLDARAAPYVRLDPARFPTGVELELLYSAAGLARRRLHAAGFELDLDEVAAVWVRRPGKPAAGEEVGDPSYRRWASEESARALTGLWDTLDCLWVPGRPRDHDAARSKPLQLKVAARLGFRIPRTLITNSPTAFLDFYGDSETALVTKALETPGVLRDGEAVAAFAHPLRRRDMGQYAAVRHAPVTIQEYVPKQVELRITVVGNRVFAAEIDSQASRFARHDWRAAGPDAVPHRPHRLPPEEEQRCVELTRVLGLCFGAIDMVLTPHGEYVFLEINPNGQWGWIQDRTGLPIGEALAGLLTRVAETRKAQ